MTDSEDFVNLENPEELRDILKASGSQLSDVLRGDAGEAFLTFVGQSLFWDKETATAVSKYEISILKKLEYVIEMNKLVDNKFTELFTRAEDHNGSWVRTDDMMHEIVDPYPPLLRTIIGKGLNLNVSKEGRGREQAVRIMTGGSSEAKRSMFGWRKKSKY